MAKYDRKMQDLKTRLSEIYDIDMMQSLLGWDQSTYMPRVARKHADASWRFWRVFPPSAASTKNWANCSMTCNPMQKACLMILMMPA